MINWKSLISTINLKLAWRRINTERNLQYKRFFREAYLVYESAADEHIKYLHKKLKANDWQPNYATRLYIPKSSGLQRPLSLLNIEDQIVLQAITNEFAEKLYKQRQSVELKTVFSNKLASPKDSIFFTDRWQGTYRAFQNKCTNAFKSGHIWSMHFDLAAYYDTISHDLLLSIVSSQSSAVGDEIKRWLGTWSADNRAAVTGHGIPQGPVASDFLAEAFFLPIDIKMQKATFNYLRYVDDIRLFGDSENKVREAGILLEQECRHRCLIPQSTKFAVRKLNSADEAMGALPSIAPTDGKVPAEQRMTVSEARKIIKKAVDGRPQKIKDKSRFRYVMYRAPADQKILGTVLRLFPRHPEHIDAFVAYFWNYGKSNRIANAALDYLESGVPYSYVRGELWHIVARLADAHTMQRGLAMARQDSRIRKRCVVLSCGVMHFLMKCEKKNLIRIGKRLQAEHPISRSLLAPIFADREFLDGGHVVTLLKGTLMEQLAGARELQRRNVTLNFLRLRRRDLPDSCNRALKSLGVIRRQHRRASPDWIGRTLVSLYGCNDTPIWREMLGSEYEHAHQIMMEVKTLYCDFRSNWLPLQDSFFDITIRKFFEFLMSKGIGRNLKSVDKNGIMFPYGRLIGKMSGFGVEYLEIDRALRKIHDRRNKIPSSHPYHSKGGAQNKWLTKKERNRLVHDIKIAVDGIVAIVEKNK